MDLSDQVDACRTAKEKLPLRSRPLTICSNIVAPLCCIAILHRYSASLFCLPEFSMAFLQGKKILITGLLSNRSIAYGIAQACKREGAELAFTYVGERFKQRITDFADEFGSKLIFDCDVGSDEQINALFAELGKSWPQLDGMVHSIGFAPREAITGDFLEGLSRESFKIAHDISAYSFPAMAKAALPLLRPNSALLTLTYMGSVRAAPNYNTMGLAKASLEASVRYLAESLGPKGVRVNGISAGPIKTLAASGIKDFGKLLGVVAAHAPLRRNVTIEEVGNTAAFLLSDLASGITSEITYVDGGFSNVLYGPGLAE
jgi:enoyl-[acyl-carrier protein] reductase I